jgi:cysteine synthase A
MNVFFRQLPLGGSPPSALNRMAAGVRATVLVKVEGRNPSYSVKCRTAASMIWEAERTGELTAGMTIVEPTSGNTGIALAMVGAARGYPVVLTMPESMSLERRRVLSAMGATLVLNPCRRGMGGAMGKAQDCCRGSRTPVHAQQFSNPANPLTIERTTVGDLGLDRRQVAAVVAGVGTGAPSSPGPLLQAHRRSSRQSRPARESRCSPSTKPACPSPPPRRHPRHRRNFLPKSSTSRSLAAFASVHTQDAWRGPRLARMEGLLSASQGAAVAAALRLASEKDYENRVIVAILPDTGERYLSTSLFA